MSTYPFSDVTVDALTKAGWTPSRQIDIADYHRLATEAGGPSALAACAFLQQFGNLEIIDGDGDDVYVNTLLPEITRGDIVHRDVETLQSRLFYIGRCVYEFEWLLMDSDGAVYRHMEMTPQNFGGINLIKFAVSGEDAIEKLLQESRTGVDAVGEVVAHWE